MTLELKDIYKNFGENRVLQGIDLKAEGGKAMGLLGRNGAGKTTAIRIIMGVFPPDKGEVLFDGSPLKDKNVSIGYLPEEHGLYPKIQIMEQLVYLGRLRGMKSKDAKISAAKWMKRLEIDEYLNRRLETLSKGNQQKVQLVATLLTNPSIVILDEPFSGLDPVNAALLKDVVKELIKKGKTVLFSSHQMNYVEEFCDDIAILHQGKIVLSGDIAEIKRSYDRNMLLVRSRQNEEILNFCKNKLTDILVKAERRQAALSFTLKSDKDKGALMVRLYEQGFDIDNIGVFEPSLNDIFVEHTGDDNEKKGGLA